MLENIIKFLEDTQNLRVFNQLTQLLGKQRKQEKSLTGERIYFPRVEEKLTTNVGEVLQKEGE